MKKQIPMHLVEGLSEKDKQTYEEYFFSPSCKVIREALVKYSEKQINNSVAKTDSSSRLQLPSYSESQAYESGYRRAIRDFIDLINR